MAHLMFENKPCSLGPCNFLLCLRSSYSHNFFKSRICGLLLSFFHPSRPWFPIFCGGYCQDCHSVIPQLVLPSTVALKGADGVMLGLLGYQQPQFYIIGFMSSAWSPCVSCLTCAQPYHIMHAVRTLKLESILVAILPVECKEAKLLFSPFYYPLYIYLYKDFLRPFHCSIVLKGHADYLQWPLKPSMNH